MFSHKNTSYHLLLFSNDLTHVSYVFMYLYFFLPFVCFWPLSSCCAYSFPLSFWWWWWCVRACLCMYVARSISAALSGCLLLQPLLPPGSPASFSSPAVHNGTCPICGVITFCLFAWHVQTTVNQCHIHLHTHALIEIMFVLTLITFALRNH